MRIEKDCFLQNLNVRNLGIIQVPTFAFLYIPTEYQELPDAFFLELKNARCTHGRLSFGKEVSYLFLSRIGTLSLFDKIYEVLEKQKEEFIRDYDGYVEQDPVYEPYYTRELSQMYKITREYCLDAILKEID